jgi:predicted nuclease of predicted toxin-antitoxin system
MRLYLDEHIHLTIASLLHARGIDCLTTRDAGNLSFSDEAQLAFATSQGRAILTFNHTDFLQLATQWHEMGRSHTGILLSKELAIPELIRRLHRFITSYATTDLTDCVIWLPSIPRHT